MKEKIQKMRKIIREMMGRECSELNGTFTETKN